jgi:lipopolysaccharide transport system ATP-binding protein
VIGALRTNRRRWRLPARPSDEAWESVPAYKQLNDGTVLCDRLAICRADGRPSLQFRQGATAYFYADFTTHEDLSYPGTTIELGDGIRDTEFRFVAYRDPSFDAPGFVPAGSRLRVVQPVRLDVAPGRYCIDLQLSVMDAAAHEDYQRGELPWDIYKEHAKCRCLIRLREMQLTVEAPPRHVQQAASLSWSRDPGIAPAVPDSLTGPALFHVTQPKAGSLWIYMILRQLFPGRIVYPQNGSIHFTQWPLKQGRVYPTVYVSRDRFLNRSLPPDSSVFIVIRDPRDVLVSLAFSSLKSHGLISREKSETRSYLQGKTLENTLLNLLTYHFAPHAGIQESWLDCQYPLVRYEDLLQNDVMLIQQTLIDRCRMPITRSQVEAAVVANRFEHLSGGRLRGDERADHHYRKGVAGDLQVRFTERVKDAFKQRYGELLIKSGYEQGLDW